MLPFKAGPLAGLQKLVNIDFSSAAPPQTDIAAWLFKNEALLHELVIAKKQVFVIIQIYHR